MYNFKYYLFQVANSEEDGLRHMCLFSKFLCTHDVYRDPFDGVFRTATNGIIYDYYYEEHIILSLKIPKDMIIEKNTLAQFLKHHNNLAHIDRYLIDL